MNQTVFFLTMHVHMHNTGKYGLVHETNVSIYAVLCCAVNEEWVSRRAAHPNLWRLVCAYRDHGHRVADLDPLQLSHRCGEGREEGEEGGEGETSPL